MDLFLYNRMGAVRWGSDREFIGCPRLDDLQCAFTSMKGFLAAENNQNINIYACFDNEEVGSGTKQEPHLHFFMMYCGVNKALERAKKNSTVQ